MTDLFCFGCNYPGEEHDERCEHFVDVDRLVEQRDRFAQQLAAANAEIERLEKAVSAADYRRYLEREAVDVVTAQRDAALARAAEAERERDSYYTAMCANEEQVVTARYNANHLRALVGELVNVVEGYVDMSIEEGILEEDDCDGDRDLIARARAVLGGDRG